VDRPEVFLHPVRVREEVDELAVEGGKAVEARESLDDPSQGRLNRTARGPDPRDREVASPRDPIRPFRGHLGRPAEGLVQEALRVEDRGEIEHGTREPLGPG
jgi:hypothetical protein